MTNAAAIQQKTLFDRLGGEAAVDAAVELFYKKVLGDTTLKPFFEGTDMRRQSAKQKMFMTAAFGGPVTYDGRSMRAAHANAVSNGLADEHFNSVAGHLQSTLEELGVEGTLIEQVMAIVGGTRDDVLGRSAA